MNQITKSKLSRPSSTEKVNFTDGMLVTADDLQAAMHYPLSVIQVLLRSYFGCGIVCGLEVTGSNPKVSPPENRQEPSCEDKPSYVVRIAPGVALGCDGYPIELCSEVKLDLSPEKCGCPIAEKEARFIAIRRESSAEPSPHSDCCSECGCGSSGSGGMQQCSRQRDHALIQVFDAAPKGACMQPAVVIQNPEACDTSEKEEKESVSLCECMRQCPQCDRCADPWVVIAVLEIDKTGIVDGQINGEELVKAVGGRRYVKPIACLCMAEGRSLGRGEDFEKRIQKLEAANTTEPGLPPS